MILGLRKEETKMKKLMTIAAVLFIAVAANAASITWGAAWVYSSAANGSLSMDLYNQGTLNGTAYLVLLGGSSSAGVAMNGSLQVTGGTVIDTESMAGTGSTPTFVASYGAAANGQYYAMVVIDSDTGRYGVSDALQLTDLAGTPPTGNVIPFANEAGYNNGGELALTQPVPEPASLALFGIGAALFGLRRKFRKA